MGLVAERLNLRLFIDGIEVPVIGAKCNFSEGAMSTAAIQVIATDQVYDIEPRAFVTLFIYDNFDFIDSPSGERNATRIGSQDLRRWKLLFSGEFISISMAKQGTSRSATLTCVDHTNYWDFIKQQYINFSNAGVELFEAAFMGIKQDRLKFFDVVTQGANSKLYIWLTQSKNKSGNPSLYLGIQRTLREMFFSVNDFYAEMFNRLRIGDSIVGLAEDETAAKLFNLQFFEKFIKNKVGGAGGMVTVRQLVDSLLGPVFHTYVTVPCPRFDRKGAALGFKPEKNSELSKGIIGREDSWPGSSLNYTIIKPDTWFLAAPMCNVVFPHMYRSLNYGRAYLAEPTRMFLRTSLLFTGKDKWMTERFYAPDFKSFNNMLYKEGGYLERLANTFLPHERFVGLNPAQVWENDLPAYVAKGARREYLSQLTHYLFWKYKFGTRTVSVSGPLNLNLVPGYPGLVVDRVQSEVGVTRHFLGNITSVVHSVDQTGGWTHFSLGGARVHDEQVDFDDEGRSLEEVVARGTDGFLDDRYESNRIGPEVYQQLFGCESIVDILEEAEKFVSVTKKVNEVVQRDTTADERAILIESSKRISTLRALGLDQATINSLIAAEIVDRDAKLAFVRGDTTLTEAEILRVSGKLIGVYQNSGMDSETRNDLIDAEIARRNAEIANLKRSASNRTTQTVERKITEKQQLALIPLAVEKIHRLYSEIVKNGQNVDLFTKTLTNRPKANFPEMMGTDLANVPPNRSQSGDGSSNASLEEIWKQDADLARFDGFFATAVNPDAKTTKNNSYLVNTSIRKEPKKAKQTQEIFPAQGSFDAVKGEFVVTQEATTIEADIIIYEVKIDTETATYGLKENLDLRREKVKAYVNSLLFRGMRG